MKIEGKLPVGETFIQFHEDHVFERMDLAETKVSYESIERIVVNVDANKVYLFIGATGAFIVPFSVFENDADKDAFLTFVRNKTGAADSG
ncbi:MAG: YcxB family protein [Candidatus Methanoplasma sp.]|jgi:hypothetical protein|nr:YcxB family protein [Candidatus Methanoplasma sp.]